ncbi:MAG TPA: hypothetical protein VIF57_06320 [Polyangia bacterium]|jgi:hypothetical protein
MAREDARTARIYDRRTVERNIKKGLLTRKDYEKHLKSLDDVAEKGVYGGSADDDVDDIDDTDDAADEAGPAADEAAAPTNNQGH